MQLVRHIGQNRFPVRVARSASSLAKRSACFGFFVRALRSKQRQQHFIPIALACTPAFFPWLPLQRSAGFKPQLGPGRFVAWREQRLPFYPLRIAIASCRERRVRKIEVGICER